MSQNATPTPSLRRRVTLAAIGLIALLLLLLSVAIDVAFGTRLTADLNEQLADRTFRAANLVEAGVGPQELVNQLQGRNIRVQVVSAEGKTYGDLRLIPALPLPPQPEGRPSAPPEGGPPPPPEGGPPPPPEGGPPPPPEGGPPPPPEGGPPPPSPRELTALTVTRRLADGSLLTIKADTTGITHARANLRKEMLIGALGTLALAALAVRLVAGRALSPLQRLTATADGITHGDRGRRIHPDRPQTELGNAAAAFDRMLDALESAEQRANDAATTARRAEAQSRQFLSDAAHELRTPLAGIQVVADQLIAGTGAHFDATDSPSGSEARARRHAELLGSETRRAARLVQDLLDIARIDAGLNLRLEHTDLGRIVAAEVDRAAMLAPGLTVRRTGDQQLFIDADPTKIAQILSNLLDNARRHTPSPGQITVQVENIDGTAQVAVADTGPGVPDSDREKIFDRLVRLDDARDRDSGGAGLGLPIARALAEAHHGTLVCLPTDGGATFRLSLPTSQPPQPNPAQRSPD